MQILWMDAWCRGTDATMTAARIAELEAENATLRAALASQETALSVLRGEGAQLRTRNAELNEQLSVLLHRIRLMSRRMYANTSERHHPGQGEIFPKEAGPQPAAGTTVVPSVAAAAAAAAATTDAPATAPASPAEATPAATTKRGGKKPGSGGRRPLPKHVDDAPDIILDLPPDQRIGSDGKPLVVVGREVSEKLDFDAGGFRRQRTIKLIYGRPFQDDEPRLRAPTPPCIVPGGKATDALVIHLLISKYSHHLPLYRLEEIAREMGVSLPRQSIMDWLRQATDLLTPVAEAIKSMTLAAAVLHVDDTPVRQQAPGTGKCLTARFWVYRCADGVWYHYTENRAGEHPQSILEAYTGLLVADAYAGFDKIFASGAVLELACWAHARRKFYEALHPPDRPTDTSEQPPPGDPRAEQALAIIRALYAIERDIADLTPDERHRHRQDRSVPLLRHFKVLLDGWTLACRPTEPLAKATTYALNQWQALGRFVDHGIAPIDNNPAENALRPIAIGRKNWLFTGSLDGGTSGAVAYTLIQSAKLHGLNPRTYLAHIVAALHAGADPRTLTPDRIAQSAQAAA